MRGNLGRATATPDFAKEHSIWSVGTVTLSRWHSTLDGASYRVVVPITFEELASGAEPAGEMIVAYDDLGSTTGQRIAISEGGEAAQPFLPTLKPVDVYNAAILDTIDLNPTAMSQRGKG